MMASSYTYHQISARCLGADSLNHTPSRTVNEIRGKFLMDGEVKGSRADEVTSAAIVLSHRAFSTFLSQADRGSEES